jgi:N-acyl-D-aspartate/D-glutamate deacylase
VHWNLLSVTGTGEREMERLRRQLGVTAYARERGAEVVALTLPSASTVLINFSSGFLFDALPGWAPLFRLPHDERIRRLRDPFYRATLKDAAASENRQFAIFANWPEYTVVQVQNPANKAVEGRKLKDIAGERNADPFDVMLDLAVDDKLLTSFSPDMGGADQAAYKLRGELMQKDAVLVGGSDAGAHMDMIDSFAFSTKLLQRSREHDLMSVEKAVHLMTQVPAEFMGIRDRGLLKPGYYADVVIFDPDRVACGPAYLRFDLPGTSTDGRLYNDAIGIDCVIVNGQPFIRNNRASNVRAGTVFRSGRDTYTVGLPRMRAA